jgi:hypothetical protein
MSYWCHILNDVDMTFKNFHKKKKKRHKLNTRFYLLFLHTT